MDRIKVNSFTSTLNNAIGLYDAQDVASLPGFKIGTSSESLQEGGRVPVVIMLLNFFIIIGVSVEAKVL